jgi:hypothetical protein
MLKTVLRAVASPDGWLHSPSDLTRWSRGLGICGQQPTSGGRSQGRPHAYLHVVCAARCTLVGDHGLAVISVPNMLP